MNTMSYKGYMSRVEYDEHDNIFVGRVLGIRSIISFHGDSAAQLRREFEKSIKDYLAECEGAGIQPETPAPPLTPVELEQ
jgi:predicted HicB family RNase H-like nuclease